MRPSPTLPAEQLRQLDTAALLQYLKISDWKQVQSLRPYIEIFRRSLNDQVFEVQVVTNKTYYQDYEEAKLYAVREIAAAETLSLEACMNKLLEFQKSNAGSQTNVA